MASYKGTWTAIGHNGSDGAFRTWGSAVSNGFAACGWTKVTGIGEVDWATVATPATASLVAGFEIWKMADALQATTPMALRIEYGSHTANTWPQMWLQIGSNNSGNALTGVLSNRQNVYASANTTVAAPWFVCGDTNRILFAGWTGALANAVAFGIERTHDAAGADIGEGILFGVFYGSGVWYQQYWNCQTGPCTGSTNALVFMPPAGALAGAGGGTTGATTTLYPLYFYKGVYTYPALNYLFAFQQNITNGSILSFTHYGATHTYLPLNTITPNVISSPLTSGNVALLLRWE